jgi:hypothetical protein
LSYLVRTPSEIIRSASRESAVEAADEVFSHEKWGEFSDASFHELWQGATIALDANVLLNLYRYPASARDHLLSALKQLSARLFVPYQAALEYQRCRLGTIAEQLNRFDEVRKVLRDTEHGLQGGFQKLQLQKRHASINPNQLLNEVKNLFESFRGELDVLQKKHPDVVDEDEIRNVLEGVLAERIGPPPEQKDLDLLYAEGKRRYEQKCPPSYDDSRKSKGDQSVYTSNGLRIESQYGDLLVWKQILLEASQKQIKQLIFVTDDEKPDWWSTLQSSGPKTLGPRPELIEEALLDAGVSLFHMYNSEQFLKYAKKYLGVEVRSESLDQIRDVRRQFEPRLQYGGITGDDSSWSHNPLGYPQLVRIRNTQVAVANTATNVTARVEYIHASGDKFTVNEATWLAKKELSGESSSIEPSVSLSGNESQSFVLMQIDRNGNCWASTNMSQPIGLLEVGKWTAKVTVSSETCKQLQGTIGFTVLPDKGLVYDHPAFRYTTEE